MNIDYVDSPPEPKPIIVNIDYYRPKSDCEPKQQFRKDLLFYDKIIIPKKNKLSTKPPTIKPKKIKSGSAAKTTIFATLNDYLASE